MPSFNTAIPTLPKRFDLRDVVDAVDRKVEVSEQAAVLLLQQLSGLQIDPETGAAWTSAALYPKPSYVDVANYAAYKSAVDGAVTAAQEALAHLQAIVSLHA